MCWFDLPQIKQELISSILKLGHEFPREFQNKIRPRVLGKKQVTEKSQNWVETDPSSQPAFTNKTLIMGAKTYAEVDINVFWPCQILLDVFTYCIIFSEL